MAQNLQSMTVEDLQKNLDLNWLNKRQINFVAQQLNITESGETDSVQKIRVVLGHRQKPLPFSRDQLMAQALPQKQTWSWASFIAGTVAMFLIVWTIWTILGIMAWSSQSTPISVGNQSQPTQIPTQLVKMLATRELDSSVHCHSPAQQASRDASSCWRTQAWQQCKGEAIGRCRISNRTCTLWRGLEQIQDR